MPAPLSIRAPFLCIWLGQMVSNIGSGLTGVVLGMWVLQNAPSVTDFSMLVLALQLPGFVFLPLAGGLADRWNRRTVMGLCLVGGTVSTLGLLVLFQLDALTLNAVLALGTVTFTCISFHGPSYTAAITQLVPRELLAWASGLTQLSMGVTLLVAPILGAVMAQVVGLGGVLAIDMTTFAFALALLAFVRLPQVAPYTVHAQLLTELLDGWRHLRRQRALLWLITLLSCHSTLLGLAQAVLPPLLFKIYSNDNSSQWTLVSFAMAGLGLIVGGGIVALRSLCSRFTRGILIAETTNAIGLLLLCWADNPMILGIGLFLVFFSIPFSSAWMQVLIQVLVPVELQGRLIGCVRMILRLALPLGTLAAGPLADRIFVPLFSEAELWGGAYTNWLGRDSIGGLRSLLLGNGVLALAIAVLVNCNRQVRNLDNVQSAATSL